MAETGSTALTTVPAGEVVTAPQREVAEYHPVQEVPAAVPALPAEAVDAAFSSMAWWDEASDNKRAAALREKWGSDAGVNLQFAMAFAEAHPDVNRLFYENGLGDHPVLIEAAAWLGRKYAEVRGRPAGMQKQRKVGPMSDADEIEFAGSMEELRGQINAAQAKGQSKLANMLYAEEQRRLAARVGSQPIVGGGGRTA